MDKCKIRERILKFFETKKLCTRAYTRAFYKNDPEVYEWLIHYFDDEPSLKNVSLAQKLWHIKHQIDKALPNKFINYQVGYTGVHKKERRFKKEKTQPYRLGFKERREMKRLGKGNGTAFMRRPAPD